MREGAAYQAHIGSDQIAGNQMKKTSVLSEPVSPEVAAFCIQMEGKLQREGYPDVTSWEHFPTHFLVRQLESKVKELRALETRPGELFVKMLTIGSLAMMLAELSSRQSRTDRGKSPDIILSPRMLCPTGTSRGGQE